MQYKYKLIVSRWQNVGWVRSKGTFDNGFKVGVHLTKDSSKVTELCTAMIGNK